MTEFDRCIWKLKDFDAAADDCCTLLPEDAILMEHVITFM